MSAYWSAARPLVVAAAVTWLAASLVFAPAALAAGIFAGMGGAWRGDGAIDWYDGSTERLRCKATNDVSDSGNKIKQVLECANPSRGEPLKFTTNLTYREAAGVVNGTWNESSLLGSGTISGRASGTNIDARVNTVQQNVSVRVSVVTRGGRQTVTMNVTTPEGLTKITVSMRKG